jgi:GAF domain-containing protein
VGDLAADRRWPRWAAKVTALGIASVLAAELRGHDARRIGSITVYWSRRQAFTEDDIAVVNTFARHAALALAQTWNDDGLNLALDGRKPLRQAQGTPIERDGLDQSRANEVLRR